MLHPEYRRIVQLLADQGISYVLLRYPHLIPRDIPDIDLLIETTEQYRSAQELLTREGYVPLTNEKLRTFFSKKVGGTLILIDVYQEVSWWGWVVMDKKQVFQRKREVQPLIVIPSVEDELLIYVGQGIFKNRRLDEHKARVVRTLLQGPLNRDYLNLQLNRYGWKGAFDRAVDTVQKSTGSISFSNIFVGRAFLRALMHAPLPRSRIFFRTLRYAFRMSKRKATVICLLGPDGSGKSTLSKWLAVRYPLFLQKFNVTSRQHYFGWDPFLPLTKVISKLFKKKSYSIVAEANKQPRSFSLSQELFFGYYYIEYLAKYFYFIFPRRWKKEVIIVDRYFYDLAVHYRYAEQSILLPLLLQLYPKPDFTFLLDAPVETLQQRKPEMEKDTLTEHRKRYITLQSRIPVTVLLTKISKEESGKAIINGSWKSILQRVK